MRLRVDYSDPVVGGDQAFVLPITPGKRGQLTLREARSSSTAWRSHSSGPSRFAPQTFVDEHFEQGLVSDALSCREFSSLLDIGAGQP